MTGFQSFSAKIIFFAKFVGLRRTSRPTYDIPQKLLVLVPKGRGSAKVVLNPVLYIIMT